MAAASLGTTIFLLQIAQHQGYIKINWTLVEKSLNKAKSEMRSEAKKRYPGIFANMQKFMQNNIILATAFAGGFFFGVAI
ncbi:FUN14 domain-containing protein 1-like [Gigantopelta aegis]|uniref:FUN14 domain-containing protein 1-like n=1 Tax=Gigantopelta aegis TaxID=1735272 RepID=UPI001B88A9B2|nr:FUN14 domain-containing protein 1-like [Gigantopelta aegis]